MTRSRHIELDVLKVLGSQLIVLHHLAAYGPVADAVTLAAPALMDWLYEYARVGVQIFLVLGGYLAVKKLSPMVWHTSAHLVGALALRFRRLVLPFLVALLLAIACAALARQWIDSEFVPQAPRLGQALAHLLLLHGILNVNALSAGVWYVAIDFQLFVLLALLLHFGYRATQVLRFTQFLVVSLMIASLFYFNRNENLDNWALYFFGSYGLGASAAWATQSRRPLSWLCLLTLVGVLALVVDFRIRIAVALSVALWLAAASLRDGTAAQLATRLEWFDRRIHVLGQSSYSLFLIHFPVLLLGNAVFAKMNLSSPGAGIAMFLGCWALSNGLSVLFERYVEAPLARWGMSKGSTNAAAARPVQSTSPRTR